MAEKYYSLTGIMNLLNRLVSTMPFSYCNGILAVKHGIVEIEPADVVEVKRANWIEDGYYNEPCVCSNCGEPCRDTVMGKPRWHYCPYCGAKMEEGE